MNRRITQTILIAAALMLQANLSIAAEGKAATPGKVVEMPNAAKKTRKAAVPANPVDINRASKAQLKKLPGVDDAIADKIIAGRPYLTKAHLVTHNILSSTHYAQIKDQIIARQK